MTTRQSVFKRVREAPAVDWLVVRMREAPVLAYLVGTLAAVGLEIVAGRFIARALGLRGLPVLFGTIDVLEHFGDLDLSGILGPLFPATTETVVAPLAMAGAALVNQLLTFLNDIPPALLTTLQVTVYNLIVFGVPIVGLGVLLTRPAYWLMERLPRWVGMLLQFAVLYAVVRLWGATNDYRGLVLMYIGINVILSVSLNLVNGYMGEFSVGHGGFMAVGAYVSAILTMWLFINEDVFGPALLPWVVNLPLGIGQGIGFVLALFIGGVASAVVSLLVAIPSFRTRGDYLAIVTLALNFIVLAAVNNMDYIGGARGLNGVPLWSNVAWVFVFAVLSVLAVHNLVTSTFGKGIIAIREDEIAADIMSVDTKRVKLVAFMFSSFLAGIAGGLFGHVLAYVNPGTFGILKSTEVLVMVYLGGMGSITGSIVAALIFTILLEALRPLGVLKWVFIPLILILLMLYRPQGLFGNREITLNLGFRGRKDEEPEEQPDGEVSDAALAD
jgi:branched-chain amino acid transport system permease protein